MALTSCLAWLSPESQPGRSPPGGPGLHPRPGPEEALGRRGPLGRLRETLAFPAPEARGLGTLAGSGVSVQGVCQAGVPGSPKHSTPSPEWKGGGYPSSLIGSLALALLMSKPKPSPHRDRHTHPRSAHPWAAWETGVGMGRNPDAQRAKRQAGQARPRAGTCGRRQRGSPSLLVVLPKSQRDGDPPWPRWGPLSSRGGEGEPGGLWGGEEVTPPKKQRPVRKERALVAQAQAQQMSVENSQAEYHLSGPRTQRFPPLTPRYPSSPTAVVFFLAQGTV